MSLGRYVKTPAERKRYAIDYSEWLETGETVSTYSFSVSPTTSPVLEIDATSLADANQTIVFFVSGGVNGQQYTVDVQATTSGGQIKEDTILFSMRDAA